MASETKCKNKHLFYKNKNLDKPRPLGTPALQFECSVCERPGIENDRFAWSCGNCPDVHVCTFCVVDSDSIGIEGVYQLDVAKQKIKFDLI